MTSTPEAAPASEPDEEARPYVLLVPVGSEASVRRTAPIAILLARAHEGTVAFLAVRRLRYDAAARPDRVPDWLTRAVDALDQSGVTIEAVARLGQSVVGAITETAREIDAAALLLHWESDELTIPRAEREAFTQLFAQPPCTALMLRGQFLGDAPPSILIATRSQLATTVAAQTASDLLRQHGGRLRVLRVVDPDASDEELAEAAATATDGLPPLPARSTAPGSHAGRGRTKRRCWRPCPMGTWTWRSSRPRSRASSAAWRASRSRSDCSVPPRSRC